MAASFLCQESQHHKRLPQEKASILSLYPESFHTGGNDIHEALYRREAKPCPRHRGRLRWPA